MRRLYTDVVALQSPANGEESAISQCRSPLLKKLLTIGEGFPDLEDALKFFEQSFDHEEALLANNIVPKEGVDEDYDAAKAAVEEIEGELEEHLKEVQKKLGCKKVIYKDIGNEKYQLEIPVTVKVPSSYMLKSSTKAAKRYWTGFIEARHLPLAEARAVFNRVVKETHVRTLNRFDTCSDLWKKAVACISEFDCLLSLHMCSMSLGEPRCRPILMESDDSTPPVLDLKSMRHPTIAHRLSEGYVPNDTLLGLNEESKGAPIVLLTGPNMGGKSTLLRQTCMAIVMAQLGCFIPAESCRMTLTDRIFTRIGANDNILAGQSTFMVELKETSNILQHATKNSLVILDELGRGTSTFDGYAIAFAVLKHLINDVGCRAMFATHYHMLCEEFKRERSVANMHMSCLVDEDKRDVTFLYQLALGVCSKSYGMNVANMAGVPRQVIERAEEKAKLIEINGGYSRMAHTYSTSNPEFLTLFKALKDNDSQQLMNLLEGL
ncbi:hypothetical protein SARC_07637 [Sphaeroforma arctica JP610]|uniref:DNA mismatch repair proteins mutS family domain-containing protein n=1 Tax=Sphaeroforma arctica JP610 TaxID=667725 RepID=A0A0L0FT55_9EUKA|nr:hypothetical protein SARC_07637 [Sphaeroforma arctica JP610]KNC79982.1 hypothetical protein SARC_07637 [Sphaeroforma arctica JP610]|eukprot:XP_014153884.1 hypothetical protein SARC_07637 [Sphaeroforma arctica JP610]